MKDSFCGTNVLFQNKDKQNQLGACCLLLQRSIKLVLRMTGMGNWCPTLSSAGVVVHSGVDGTKVQDGLPGITAANDIEETTNALSVITTNMHNSPDTYEKNIIVPSELFSTTMATTWSTVQRVL